MLAGDRPRVAELKRVSCSSDDDDDRDETAFVWESDAGVLGGFVSVALRPWAEGCAGGPVPYVEGWYVAEALRRRGVGRALIDAAEGWAREMGFREIGSDARLDNAICLQAHRRLGFVPTERLQFFRKSLGPLDTEAEDSFRVEPYPGDRARIRPLFELAEDSSEQLDSYIDSGRVLVAVAGNEIIGHIQLVETGRHGEIEIKNLAVAEKRQGRGIGRMLVTAVIDEVAAASGSRLLVATAAAGTGELRFYQRLGFRLCSIERDAFTAATGYPAGIRLDGIELRDRVWLDFPLEPPSPGPSRAAARD